MRDAAREKRRAVWRCPKCKARLVTRNMWHSCGRFTLEALFRASTPRTLRLARKFVALLRELGDVQVLVQKTRLVCVARVRFAGLVPRKDHFLVGFALRRRLTHARIIRHEDFGPRWRAHWVAVRSERDLDAQLRRWLRMSCDTVGAQR